MYPKNLNSDELAIDFPPQIAKLINRILGETKKYFSVVKEYFSPNKLFAFLFNAKALQ